MKKRPPCADVLPSFLIVEYFLFIAATGLFLIRIDEWPPAMFLLLVPALFFYPLLYLSLSIVVSCGTALAALGLENKHPLLRRWIVGSAAFLTTFLPHLLLHS